MPRPLSDPRLRFAHSAYEHASGVILALKWTCGEEGERWWWELLDASTCVWRGEEHERTPPVPFDSVAPLLRQ